MPVKHYQLCRQCHHRRQPQRIVSKIVAPGVQTPIAVVLSNLLQTENERMNYIM